MEKGIKLIEEANDMLMDFRVKSDKQKLTEAELYKVQMLLYKAIDQFRQVSDSLPPYQNGYKAGYAAGLEAAVEKVRSLRNENEIDNSGPRNWG